MTVDPELEEVARRAVEREKNRREEKAAVNQALDTERKRRENLIRGSHNQRIIVDLEPAISIAEVLMKVRLNPLCEYRKYEEEVFYVEHPSKQHDMKQEEKLLKYEIKFHTSRQLVMEADNLPEYTTFAGFNLFAVRRPNEGTLEFMEINTLVEAITPYNHANDIRGFLSGEERKTRWFQKGVRFNDIDVYRRENEVCILHSGTYRISQECIPIFGRLLRDDENFMVADYFDKLWRPGIITVRTNHHYGNDIMLGKPYGQRSTKEGSHRLWPAKKDHDWTSSCSEPPINCIIDYKGQSSLESRLIADLMENNPPKLLGNGIAVINTDRMPRYIDYLRQKGLAL